LSSSIGSSEGTILRPSWDEYFLGIALAVAARADCTRAQHGAVIVKQNRIVGTGYNGSPPGGPSCLTGGCPRGQMSREDMPGHLTGNHDYSNCISLHAEQNAIGYAVERGDTIYITGKPCDMCAKLIRAAGIERVVYPEGD
jgi:dCMP deaminase